ncbi:MAG TPA: hypothetical protein VIV11_12345 [Kofleriaceae bacterium]
MRDLNDAELLSVVGGQLATPTRRGHKEILAERRHERALYLTAAKIQSEMAAEASKPQDNPLMKAMMGFMVDMMKKRK